MGCSVSTTIATDDAANTIDDQAKDGDITQLARVTADSGDLSVNDANVFGDQLDLNKGTTEEDTNFHNSPLNEVKSVLSVTSNNPEIPKYPAVENDTSTSRLCSSSPMSRYNGCSRSKHVDSTNVPGQILVASNVNVDQISQQDVPNSVSSSRHSHVYKPTESSSGDDGSLISTKKTQEISIRCEKSQKTNSHHHVSRNNTTNDVTHEYGNSSTKIVSKTNTMIDLDREKSEKNSQTSRTLSESNRSPYFDSVNANAENNQNYDEEVNNENAITGTGDINQYHELNAMLLLNEDFKPDSVNVENVIKVDSVDLLATGDMCFAKMSSSIEEDSILYIENNDYQSESLIEYNQNQTFPPSGQHRLPAIVRGSSDSLLLKNECLKTAEVNDTNLEESVNGFYIRDVSVEMNKTDDKGGSFSEKNRLILKLPDIEDIEKNDHSIS